MKILLGIRVLLVIGLAVVPGCREGVVVSPDAPPPPTGDLAKWETAPPGALAKDHIPNVLGPEPTDADFVTVDGSRVAPRRILAMVADTATVGAVKRALAAERLTVVGGNSFFGVLLCSVPRGADGLAIASRLETNPLFAAVTNDEIVLDREDIIPGDSPPTGSPGNPAPVLWDWKPFPWSPLPPIGGNWGHHYIRMPQAWNLLRIGRDIPPRVMIIESGSADTGHTELRGIVENLNAASAAEHATNVVGIIAARASMAVYPPFGEVGIQGINPAYIWSTPPPMVYVYRLSSGSFWYIQDALSAAIDKNVRVINVSLGGSTLRRRSYMQKVLIKMIGTYIVASAGNDGKNAKDNSPFTREALDPNNPFGWILVVENLEAAAPGARLSNQSNFAGTGAQNAVSAPGENTGTTSRGGKYAVFHGTSAAAPYVAGLVSYLLTLEPSLNYAQVAALLKAETTTRRPGASRTGQAASPGIDAFSAAIEIDKFRPNYPMRRRLLDVDDGTLDGNDRATTRLYAVLGDGAVDMSDFRAFRDALLQVEVDAYRDLAAADVDIRRRDLNRDGLRDANDYYYPRFDFNGDGVVHSWKIPTYEVTTPSGRTLPDVPQLPSGAPFADWRDVDVFRAGFGTIWTRGDEMVSVGFQGDESGDVAGPTWNRTELLLDRNNDLRVDYLRSSDVNLKVLDDAEWFSIATHPFIKYRRGPVPASIVTAPLFGTPLTVRYKRTQGPPTQFERKDVILKAHPLYGEDLVLEIGWNTLSYSSMTRGQIPALFPRPIQMMLWEKGPYGAEPEEGHSFVVLTGTSVADVEQKLRDWAKANLLPSSHLALWLGAGSVQIKTLGTNIKGSGANIRGALHQVWFEGTGP